ncbi:MAG TPA: hypothetical protein VGR61_00030, partial [Candidatus Dormibacteraeota bacterium]|nr:hypothetical protein [Candidatus Dormibacteraeota bacterium]
IDQSPTGRDEVIRLNRGMRSVPTIIFSDGSVMVEPSRRVLKAKLAEIQPGSAVAPACATDVGIPDCVTGPMGRIAFVFRELKAILTRRSSV